MIQLQMHHSNFKYVYDPVIDPNSPTCANCEFMPDGECGWGYDYLDECVFQLEKGTQYILVPKYDHFPNPKYPWCRPSVWSSTSIRHRIAVIPEGDYILDDFIENAEISGMNPFWSSDDDLDEFYSDVWERRSYITEKMNELDKDKERGWQWDDYFRWSFQKEPCSLCGKVTREFMVLGFNSECKTSQVIKVCTGCIDSMKKCSDDWISFGERLLGC